MDNKTTTVVYLAAVAALLLATAVESATPSPAATKYTNHTVGGPAGWFFNTTTNTTSADYSKWAASDTFSLGDFLIFNTNTNHSVIQTYNETTYRSCSSDDALDSDTFQFGGGDDDFNQPETIAVPLTIEGTNYFFSDSDDGVQCLNGMAFEIKVSHGLGLPPSLNQPPPPAYVAPPPSVTDAQAPPVTVIGNQPSGGGLSGVANVRWVVSVLVFVVLFTWNRGVNED